MKKMLVGLLALIVLVPSASLAHHNPTHGGGGGRQEESQAVVTICHATESVENPYNRLVVSENATGGHFENNGTPKSGHEDDLLFEGEQDCPEPVDPPTCEETQTCPPPPCEDCEPCDTDCDPDPCDQDQCDDPQEPNTTFHFIKQICASYGDIVGNQDADNGDETGGHFTEFANAGTGFDAEYAPKAINPAEIPANCDGAEGWDFQLSATVDQDFNMVNPTTVGSTDVNGELEVPFANLPADIKASLLAGNSMWVAEVTEDSADFGALRCYFDALNGDNLEVMSFGTDVVNNYPANVYCIAYNVAEDDGGGQRMATLTVTKNGDGNGSVDGSVDSVAQEAPFCDLNQCDASKEGQVAFVQNYPLGTVIDLTAIPDENSNFDNSWSGACSGNGACQITMNSNQSVNAHFGLNSNGGGGGGGGRNNDDDDDGLVQGDNITGLPYQAPGLVLGATTLPVTGFDLGLFKFLALGLPFLFLKRRESM